MSITHRIDHTTSIPAAYLSEVVPPPNSIKIELTSTCQLRCRMCSLPGREKQTNQEIDWGLYTSLIDEMVAEGISEAGLFYLGESTTSPELLVRAAKYAKRAGIDYVFLTTNGVEMTPFLFGELAPYLDSLKFSVNCADEAQWKEITRTKPALWHKALDNLKACYEVRNKEGFKTRIYASSILYDGDQKTRMEKLLDERVRPYTDETYYLPCYSEMQSPQAKENEARGWKVNAGNPGRVGALRPALPCWAIFKEGHVRSDGGVSLCCFGADGTWDCGNLKDGGFMRAWNSEIARDLRKAHLSGSVKGTVCETCVHGTKAVSFV